MSLQYYQVDPWFWEEMAERRKAGGNVVALATGQPNIGKSYWCLALLQEIHRSWSLSKITSEAIVFNSGQFWKRMQESEEEAWTLWDEPNKGLSHRDWYEEMNKAVTTFIQTFRFKKKSLLLALPHMRLVDKSARAVCLFEAMMKKPGLARIHQLEPDYFGNREFYKYFRGEVQLPMPSLRLVREYEVKKNEFHETDFPEVSFEEEPIKKAESVFDRVYQTVKGKMERYYHPSKLPQQLSPSLIAADLHCSGEIARRVRDRIELEKRTS